MNSSNGHRRRTFIVAAGVAASGLSGCIGRLGGGRSGSPTPTDGSESSRETSETDPEPGTSTVASTPEPTETETDPDPWTEEVFVSGEEGYPTYRIPSVLTTNRGTLLAFCEARQGGDRDQAAVVVKRSTDGGRTWSDHQVVYAEGELTIGNPTPVVDRTNNTIHLPLIREYRDVLMTRSTDDGKTWADPTEITDAVKKDDWGYYAAGPGVGIQLEREPHEGRLLIPATHYPYLWEGKLPDDNVRYDHAIYSDDGGETWELGETVGPNVEEPQAVELADGRVMFNMRNYWAQEGGRPQARSTRAVATSDDGGVTWSETTFDETLVTPTCQASIIRYSWPEDGKSRILFSNPAHPGNRENLTVRLSYDEGETWSHSKQLYDGPSAYSCLTVLPDGSVGCLYERGPPSSNPYQGLTFHRFTIEWLTDGADTPR